MSYRDGGRPQATRREKFPCSMAERERREASHVSRWQRTAVRAGTSPPVRPGVYLAPAITERMESMRGYVGNDARGSAVVWVLVAAIIAIAVAVVAVTLLWSPPAPPPEEPGEAPPPPPQEEEEPPELRSITVTEEEALPLLPEGATLQFMPDNRIKLGYASIPVLPTVDCGVNAGMIWLDGIPLWIDLTSIDANMHDYCSRWTPSWPFTIDTSATPATSTVTPDGTVVISDSTPTFDWSRLCDNAEVKFALQVDSKADYSAPLIAESWIRSTSYALSQEEALDEGDYHWRLMQKGRVWITGMPPWLDISRYDPEVTELPTFVAVETGDGEITVSYVL